MLIFFRAVILLVFGLSVAGKIVDMPAFQRAVRRFRILPDTWATWAAWAFLLAELACILLMIYSKGISWGFGLAFLLLVVFSVALLSVLLRGISTACNCFGDSGKAVTWCDPVRNLGFLSCAAGGWVAATGGQHGPVGILEITSMSLGAIVFVSVMTHLDEIVHIFRQG